MKKWLIIPLVLLLSCKKEDVSEKGIVGTWSNEEIEYRFTEDSLITTNFETGYVFRTTYELSVRICQPPASPCRITLLTNGIGGRTDYKLSGDKLSLWKNREYITLNRN